MGWMGGDGEAEVEPWANCFRIFQGAVDSWPWLYGWTTTTPPGRLARGNISHSFLELPPAPAAVVSAVVCVLSACQMRWVDGRTTSVEIFPM